MVQVFQIPIISKLSPKNIAGVFCPQNPPFPLYTKPIRTWNIPAYESNYPVLLPLYKGGWGAKNSACYFNLPKSLFKGGLKIAPELTRRLSENAFFAISNGA